MIRNEFLIIRKLIEKKKNIFISGGAGTGKSYILNKLKEIYGETLHITSTTGLSAINIGGQTIHSWAGIGICDKSIKETLNKIIKNSELYIKLRQCTKLAIDEISMLDCYTFDYLNTILKLVRNNMLPFGGIQMILVGDFYQLPPVHIDSDIEFCFESSSWEELNIFPIILNDSIRQREQNYIEALNNIRMGNLQNLKLFYDRSIKNIDKISNSILRIFGTNLDADRYNKKCFNEIDSEIYEYKATDKLIFQKDKNTNYFDKSKLLSENSYMYKFFNNYCKAPKILKLKEGCKVMLLKNLDIKNGLVNGSCGTVIYLDNQKIKVLFDNKKLYSITTEEFEYTLSNQLKIQRTQFPLCLAYGITIHKSQGMTINKLVVDFKNIFDYGQAYVALSRTQSIDDLYIKNFDKNKILTNSKVIKFYEKLKNNSLKY